MDSKVRVSPRRLAPTIKTLTVPSHFSPSQFYRLSQCPLSAMHGLSSDQLLLPSPSAVFGNAAHQAMARVGSGASATPLLELFEKIIANEEEKYRGDPRRVLLTPLSESVSRMRWHALRAVLKAKVQQPQFKKGGNLKPFSRQVGSIGFERAISCDALRLRGRADFIGVAEDGWVEIVEYKTGRLVDAKGSPLERHAVQVRLYALIVESLGKGLPVRLWLEGSSRIPVAWETKDRNALKAALGETLERFPSESILDDTIAVPGHWCRTCPVRHRCGPYERSVIALWGTKSIRGPVAPLDCWGRLDKVVAKSGTISAIMLIDVAGRRVQISTQGLGLSEDFPPQGSELCFFNLQSEEQQPRHGVFHHPRNFCLGATTEIYIKS